MTIKKVINNNIVSVVDERGRELIVSGRGVGFGKKAGDEVSRENIRKIYKMTSTDVQRRLIELLDEIPYEHLKLTEELIDIIRSEIPYEISENFILTLADHISFAIKRREMGMEFSNPLLDSIREYYPEEYRLGEKCVKHIAKKTGEDLGADEAGTIAAHIVNAELNTSMNKTYKITAAINDCVRVAEKFYKMEFDKTSVEFLRLSVHLRFFIQRVLDEKYSGDEQIEKELSDVVKSVFKTHYDCAVSIASYIKYKHKRNVNEPDIIYLAIELNRSMTAEK